MQKRFLLFLIGCIGVRTLFVIIAKNASTYNLQLLGYLALLPAIGFTYIYLTGSRKVGAETFGEKIWWNNLRPLHSFNYFLYRLKIAAPQSAPFTLTRLSIRERRSIPLAQKLKPSSPKVWLKNRARRTIKL